MVYFYINLEVLVETVSTEESDNCFGVDVVLVLSWFHWLRFDKESALKALSASIVASHTKHSSHVFLFTLLVGVEQAHISLATAPEYVVFSTESNAGIDSVLDLNDSASYNVEIRIGRSSVHIALVTKNVSG